MSAPTSLHDFVTDAQAAVLGNMAARRRVAKTLGGMGVERMSELLLSVCAGVDLTETSTSRRAGFIDPHRVSPAQAWHAAGLYEQGLRELPVLVATIEHYKRMTEQQRLTGRRAHLVAVNDQALHHRAAEGRAG